VEQDHSLWRTKGGRQNEAGMIIPDCPSQDFVGAPGLDLGGIGKIYLFVFKGLTEISQRRLEGHGDLAGWESLGVDPIFLIAFPYCQA
jgi:hypothetical protein